MTQIRIPIDQCSVFTAVTLHSDCFMHYGCQVMNHVDTGPFCTLILVMVF
jgi:hypothetical protein